MADKPPKTLKAPKVETPAPGSFAPPCDLTALLLVLEACIAADDPPFEVSAEEVLLLKWVVGAVSTREVGRHLPWLAPAIETIQTEPESTGD